MKVRPKMSDVQPDWVCNDCGQKWGRWWDGSVYTGPSTHCATYHESVCNVCGNTKSVTEARDYGYLRPGWKQAISG
jgi:hypothetical protein